jgi:hypothetical protein
MIFKLAFIDNLVLCRDRERMRSCLISKRVF